MREIGGRGIGLEFDVRLSFGVLQPVEQLRDFGRLSQHRECVQDDRGAQHDQDGQAEHQPPHRLRVEHLRGVKRRGGAGRTSAAWGGGCRVRMRIVELITGLG